MVGPLKDIDGKAISDDRETAEVLNDCFSSVFTLEDLNMIPNATQISLGNQALEGLNNIVIGESTVCKKFVDLNINKRPRPDGLHPTKLYELRAEL